MVVSTVTPDNFFIYGNKDKLWIVMDDQILELKQYMIDNFAFTLHNNVSHMQLLGGDTFDIQGMREMEFDLHAIVTDATYKDAKKIDASDFYDMEECKTLSKIIQRKFDKILEENGKDD